MSLSLLNRTALLRMRHEEAARQDFLARDRRLLTSGAWVLVRLASSGVLSQLCSIKLIKYDGLNHTFVMTLSSLTRAVRGCSERTVLRFRPCSSCGKGRAD